MAKDIRIVFKGEVKNGKRIYDRPKLHDARMIQLEGKRFDETIEAEREKKTIAQLGYYFAGIVGTCMMTELFGGWTKSEVDVYLRKKVTGYIKSIIHKNGYVEYVECYDDIKEYNDTQMGVYIQDVLLYLADEEKIFPLDPDEYKSKYVVDKRD